MSHIRIDYDGLEQQSAALKNYSAAYDGLCTRMKNMADQIGASWEGEAATAFEQLMQQYLQQGIVIKEILQTIKSYADTTESSFRSVDQECANLIRNSF